MLMNSTNTKVAIIFGLMRMQRQQNLFLSEKKLEYQSYCKYETKHTVGVEW